MDSEDSTDTELEDFDDEVFQPSTNERELPPDYWQIIKLLNYAKYGDPTATSIALNSMLDCDLKSDICNMAIKEANGLELLLNILDANVIKCQFSALKVIQETAQNRSTCHSLVKLKGVQSIMRLMSEDDIELRSMAAEAMSHITQTKRARKTVLHLGGVSTFVNLLTVPDQVLNRPETRWTPNDEKLAEGVRCGAMALWTLSHSARIRKTLKYSGIIKILTKLLKTSHEKILIPVLGLTQQCALEEYYRFHYRKDGIIVDVCQHLTRNNVEIQKLCAATLFKCGQDLQTRELIGSLGSLSALARLITKNVQYSNYDLMAAVTGATWTCSQSKSNVDRLLKLNAVEHLVKLLKNQEERVQVHVVGTLSFCVEDPNGRVSLRRCGGIPLIVGLLKSPNNLLLVNIARTICSCAKDPISMSSLQELDTARLLWSQLKSTDPDVQANTAWALFICLQNTNLTPGKMTSFVGGLEILVDALKSPHTEVRSSICALLSVVSQDEECLGTLTDHGVVEILAKLAKVKEPRFQAQIARAVGSCSRTQINRDLFGQRGVIKPLVKYLRSPEKETVREAIFALRQLSLCDNNCKLMRKYNAVPILVKSVGFPEDAVQEAAVECLREIRQRAKALNTRKPKSRTNKA